MRYLKKMNASLEESPESKKIQWADARDALVMFRHYTLGKLGHLYPNYATIRVSEICYIEDCSNIFDHPKYIMSEVLGKSGDVEYVVSGKLVRGWHIVYLKNNTSFNVMYETKMRLLDIMRKLNVKYVEVLEGGDD